MQVTLGPAGDAVLAPSIGAAARVVVREIVPGGAARTVILAHRAPLPVADIRTPQPPRGPHSAIVEALPLGGLRDRLRHQSPLLPLLRGGGARLVLDIESIVEFIEKSAKRNAQGQFDDLRLAEHRAQP